MPENYTIRLARSQDLEHLPKIEQSAARTFSNYLEILQFPQELLDRPVPIAKLKQAQQENMLWVAGDRHNRPIGFAYVEKLGYCWHLEELDVHPQSQKQGIGSALVKAVCDRLIEMRISAITLTTFRDIPWNAPFYQKLGFQEISFSECSIELQEIVTRENQQGLQQDKRVIMGYYCPSSPG